MCQYFLYKLLLLSFALQSFSANNNSNTINVTNYCSYNLKFCNDKSIHTACKYRPCEPGPACGELYQPQPMDKLMRAFVLDLHNRIRSSLALGEDKRIIGTIANMNILTYDFELEYIAECWVNRCFENHLKPHDECRKTYLFPSNTGQNLCHLIQPKFSDGYMRNGEIERCIDFTFFSGDRTIGHFTQLVWADAIHVGCARVKYGSGSFAQFLFCCNYGPMGNIVGKSVYKIGKPCSKCKRRNRCDDKYEGLCDVTNHILDSSSSRYSTFHKLTLITFSIATNFLISLFI
ncbi:venom allergen 3-like [Agrilus planipennis]|uniref:Venom allergen 3-like n=1 Tax=Agrilus planipennis TaxID=224129 RepID=A0A1W4WQM8_AGRPL|nr:venom allergen 3-like [Agrilus planipennis]